ncbi:MAG: hypothetical protein ACTHNS_07265 [Marmoricola sp.]
MLRSVPIPPPGRPGRLGERLPERWAERLGRWSVPAALLVTAGLHLAFLSNDLGSDEGGFAMVARHWRQPGAYLYGPQWVDRPPLLIAVFWVADHLGAYGARWMATAVAVALVAVLSGASYLATDARRATAARWTAWVSAALVSSALFDTEQLNGELVAVLLVSLAVAGVLGAVRHPGAAAPCMVGAGAAAAGAVLAKQNFVDGLAFAGIFLALGAFRGVGPRRVLRMAVAFAGGCLLPVAAAAWWAHAHGGIDELVYAMYGFRIDAGRVIADYSHAAPERRAVELVRFALASGVFTLVAVVVASQARRFRHLQPLPWAVLGTFAVELVGVVGGGNFWSHYLIALIPMVGLAAGLSCRRDQPLWGAVRAAVLLAVVATLVDTPAAAVHLQQHRSRPAQVADWLRASSRPGDSVAVPFTHANVIGMSGLEPRYPYSWSLPVRTLDPRLDLLVSTLEGERAPTWVVRWDAPHIWRLDPHDRVQKALRGHYRRVASVCGHRIWLHDGVSRVPARSTGGDCAVVG